MSPHHEQEIGRGEIPRRRNSSKHATQKQDGAAYLEREVTRPHADAPLALYEAPLNAQVEGHGLHGFKVLRSTERET